MGWEHWRDEMEAGRQTVRERIKGVGEWKKGGGTLGTHVENLCIMRYTHFKTSHIKNFREI